MRKSIERAVARLVRWYAERRYWYYDADVVEFGENRDKRDMWFDIMEAVESWLAADGDA